MIELSRAELILLAGAIDSNKREIKYNAKAMTHEVIKALKDLEDLKQRLSLQWRE